MQSWRGQARPKGRRGASANPDLAERPRFWIGAYAFPEEFIDKIVAGLRKAGLPNRDAKA